MLWLYFVREGSMAWIRIGVVLYIFSPVVVIPQLVVDDSLVPRAGADDVNLILRYFNISKKDYYRFEYGQGLNESLQEQRHFRSKMQFVDIKDQERILIGAMDYAFVLNMTLDIGEANTGVISWTAIRFDGCVNFLSSQNPLRRNYDCHNHILYFNFFPGNTDKFLLCGSNGYLPNCITLLVMDLDGGVYNVTDLTPDNRRSNELVVNRPAKSFVTVPRDVNDSVLVNALTPSDSAQGSLGIYDVSEAVLSPEVNIVNADAIAHVGVTNIIEAPQEFVSLFNLDYKLESEDAGSQDYIYVVFKEELKQLQQSSADCVTRNRQVQSWISRVARICKYDVAVSTTIRQPRSFVKADIYCSIKTEEPLQLDYAYQEIAGLEVVRDSIPSSDISESTMYGYGLFSGGGSSLGPAGSAVCIYPAERTVASGTGSQNNNNGLYDIFLRQYLGGTHNRNYNCSNNASARLNDNDYSNIEIESPLSQIGKIPLFVLDGVDLIKIQVDSKRPILGMNNEIVYRDVVFVASSKGRIYKVTKFDWQPIVSDIIQLKSENDEIDNSIIYNLELRDTVTDSPYLFASTNVSIYRLPTSECSRYTSCQECVRSRDPYCVWDINMKMCTSINKSIGSPASSSLLQDISGAKSVLESEECKLPQPLTSSPAVGATSTSLKSESCVIVAPSETSLTKSSSILPTSSDRIASSTSLTGTSVAETCGKCEVSPVIQLTTTTTTEYVTTTFIESYTVTSVVMVTPSVDVSVGGLDTTADTSSIDPIIPVSVVAGFLVIVLLVLGVFFLIIIYRRCKNGIPSKSENVPNHFENAGAE